MPSSWPPMLAYLVCATPRSGSTLLCETLRATGAAGNPLEHFEVLCHSSRPRQPREYFAGVEDPAVVGLLAPLEAPRPDPQPPTSWWERIVREGSTPNGVWGGKLMWGHVDDFLGRARELAHVPSDAHLDGALTALFGGGLRLVYVTRPDKVAQAISLWRAAQTQTWRASGGGARADATYSFAAIDHLVRQLEEQDRNWRHWFSATGGTPHEVSYDELAADPRATIAAVLEALGLPVDYVPAPATERQGDGRSQEWADRYRAQRGAVV